MNPERQVNDTLMILPANDPADIRLVKIPDDFEQHEAYRYVTGLIAQAQEDPEYTREDIIDLLEDRGFVSIDYVLGPSPD